MPPTIAIPESLFARLQAHAVPLVDTIESVIARGLDALEAGKETTKKVSSTGPRSFNPAAPPNLAHTTPKLMSMNGVVLNKNETYWNHLMIRCVKAAAGEGLSAQDISACMIVPHVLGKKEDNGYRFVPEAGLSVQGQDANGAWKQAAWLAQVCGFKMYVEFTWQNVEKAAMPNITGSFDIG